MMMKLLEKLKNIYKIILIRDHIQNLKDEGIDVNINDDQVNDSVDKIFKGIGKRNSTSEDSTSEDSDSEYSDSEYSASEDLTQQDLKFFKKKYENKSIKTFYKDSGIKYDIDTDEINNDFKDYNDKIISKYYFSQKYNTFINKFNKIERQQGKKKRGGVQ